VLEQVDLPVVAQRRRAAALNDGEIPQRLRGVLRRQPGRKA
jgi:hypothetical protein